MNNHIRQFSHALPVAMDTASSTVRPWSQHGRLNLANKSDAARTDKIKIDRAGTVDRGPQPSPHVGLGPTEYRYRTITIESYLH
jgi:hypothetical protein